MGFPKGKKRYDLDHAKRPHPGIHVPSDTIIQAIRKAKGNISRAADRLGISRQVIHSRVKVDPEVKAVLDECRERFLDDTEDVFQNKVLSGDTVSLLFALKTLGKSRGYAQDRDVLVEGATRGALDFIFNRSKNPAE